MELRYAFPALLALPLFCHAQATNYPAGSTVDNFTATDIDGVTHDLAAYAAAGKYVILDFFFYNCGPCQVHAPYYSELYQTYGCNGNDLICIEVNYGDPDALAEAFAPDFAPGFAHPPVIGSGSGDGLVSTFGVMAFPTFCLIDPDMKMVNNDIWPVSNMSTFVNAFPAGSGIDPAPCLTGMPSDPGDRLTGVFPSPSNGEVTLAFELHATAHLLVNVSDATGRIVAQQDLGTATGTAVRTLDLSTLGSGHYGLTLIADDATLGTQRITIAR